MLELLGVAIALIGTAIVAYTDHKTGYMPDKYTHSMIVLGILLLPFYSGLSAALGHYFIAALIFGACFLLYTFGQLGGGDVKLFTAMALLIPAYPLSLAQYGVNPVNSPFPFVISVFFTAAVFAMLFVSVSYASRLVNDRNKINKFNEKAVKGALYSVMIVPLAIIWYLIKPIMLVITLPLVVGAFILAFKKDILEQYVVKKKKAKDLNDDDVIALELMSKSTKKKLGLDNRKTLLNAELESVKKAARKHGIKEVIVSEYLPHFGPYILVSLILNLVVGDTLLWLLFL